MPDEALTAGDGCDDPDGIAAAELRVDAALAADILAVDVDVDEWPQDAAIVEEQVAHRQGPQCGTDRRRV